MLSISQNQHQVILFDGVCNLCSSTVRFIIKTDTKNRFLFASLQSRFAKTVLKEFHLSAESLNSFILFKSGKIYTKSTGALLVAKQLKNPWKLLFIFIVVPAFIRNAVYNLMATNRYRWFGKKESCWIPAPQVKSKFLD